MAETNLVFAANSWDCGIPGKEGTIWAGGAVAEITHCTMMVQFSFLSHTLQKLALQSFVLWTC
eukprot:3940095-Rhodomonas_salina.3